eukprot:TRINITY_DN5270_c0_g1_i1.p1 TRINITY_DN5270_c0_g1~~TRINITY_DN5270_c0_g1_i1.p1  ORF type:complete len:329 (-),score=63.89 TRINITY_DN5270_c0_g1_i1:86-1072(-)
MEVIEGKIEGQREFEGVVLPLVLVPKDNKCSKEEFLRYVNENKGELEKKLVKHGGLLFRGFPLVNAVDFNDVVEALGCEFEPYYGGGGPRKPIVGNIMTSTESPPHFVIPFHHELAYLTKYPSKLLFFCDTPAKEGGDTPIVRSDRICERILKEMPDVYEKFKSLKLRYHRVLASKKSSAATNDYQKSWEDIFDTEDKALAESRAKETGADKIKWLDDNSMEVVSVPIDGLKVDPRTNKTIWFNSAVLLHPGVYGKKNPKDTGWGTTYGDYSEIDANHMIRVYDIMKEEGVSFKWNKGDLLIIDNYVLLHSRNSFTPPRLLLAALVKK